MKGPLKKALPPELRALVLSVALEGRRAACVLADEGGVVRSAWGELELYGLAGLAAGDELGARASFLVGLFPLAAEFEHLPRIETESGRFADVRLARVPEGSLVLLLDVEGKVRRESLLHQKSNELDLMRERLGDAVEPSALSLERVLATLDVAMFERRDAREFVLRGDAPGWMMRRYGTAPRRREPIDVLEHHPFLESFLVDAEAFWESGRVGHVRSGIWTESDGDGGELHLEAFALRTAARERPGLALQALTEAYESQQEILQRARDTRLSLDALEREIDKREVLLHSIVHDLKGPLSGIVGNLSLLKKGTLAPERAMALAETALTQARRQLDMIRTVLEVFSSELDRLEGFDDDAASAPDAARCVELALEQQRASFEHKGVQLELSRAPDLRAPLAVVGREGRLVRVLGNLLENALRHAPAGSVVRVSLRAEEDRVLVQVDDRGPGVPRELEPRLFQRFARGGDYGGVAGLGLYSCRVTLERWGGGIEYHRRPEGGASFLLKLVPVGAE